MHVCMTATAYVVRQPLVQGIQLPTTGFEPPRILWQQEGVNCLGIKPQNESAFQQWFGRWQHLRYCSNTWLMMYSPEVMQAEHSTNAAAMVSRVQDPARNGKQITDWIKSIAVIYGSQGAGAE